MTYKLTIDEPNLTCRLKAENKWDFDILRKILTAKLTGLIDVDGVFDEEKTGDKAGKNERIVCLTV